MELVPETATWPISVPPPIPVPPPIVAPNLPDAAPTVGSEGGAPPVTPPPGLVP